MAEKLGFLSLWLGGDYAERNTINANADALETVEAQVGDLQQQVKRQADEIIHLRATILGLAELLQRKLRYDDGELEQEVKIAYDQLVPPPPVVPRTDPYRGLPPAAREDSDDAKRLMKAAQDHHFSKRFAAARAIYQDIVERFGDSKQAVVAQQQLDNLEGL